MNRPLFAAALAALLISAAASPVIAAPCKDAKGKFVKCPPAKPMMAAKRCKDGKGKFVKCGTPGARPA